MKVILNDSLLRTSLRGNAVFSAASGITLAASSYAIAPLLGVEPSWILLIIGLGLLPFAYDLFTNSVRQEVHTGRAKQAIAADVAWVVASVVILTTDPVGFTTVGFITVALVAAVVADFAFLQWLGLRRITNNNTSGSVSDPA